MRVFIPWAEQLFTPWAMDDTQIVRMCHHGRWRSSRTIKAAIRSAILTVRFIMSAGNVKDKRSHPHQNIILTRCSPPVLALMTTP